MSSAKQQGLGSSMARVFSIGSLRGGGAHSSAQGPALARQDSATSPTGPTVAVAKDKTDDDIVKKGTLKKYKNLKSRYFVLRCQESSPCPATLSCYDSESKFLDRVSPKRHYLLNQSTRVEPKTDSKRAFAFSIRIKNETLNLVAISSDEMNDWIRALHRIADTSDWEHVWHVEVQNRGLGGSNGGVMAGHAYLCLTKRSLSIVSMDESMRKTDIALNTIRMVAFNNMFFYLEMGRMASTGSGRLWLTTQDNNIAANIYSVVGRVMTNLSVTMGITPTPSSSSSTPRDRTVSMSATQASNCMTRDRSGSLPSRPNSALRPIGQTCGCRHLGGHATNATGHDGVCCDSVTTEAHSPGRQHHCSHHPAHSNEESRGPPPVESGGIQLSTHHEAPDPYLRMDISFNDTHQLPSSLESISSPRGDPSNRGSESRIPEENYMDMTEGLSSPSDNSSWLPSALRDGDHSSLGLCHQHSEIHHHHHHQFLHHHHHGSDSHQLHCNSHHYTNNAAAVLAANRDRMVQTPVSPSPEVDSGSYLNMSLAKPIPASAVDETSPGSASSSYTSGAGTPSSDHRHEHSSSCSLHHQHQEKQLLQSYQELAAAGGVAMTSSNLSMETDSVPDVEESVDDILDGASQEDERSARLRLDSLDHCGDDLDMDMEDQDQIDSAGPASSIGLLDPASARSCMDAPTSSTISMSVPGFSPRLSSGCSGLLSSSVPAPYALHHYHHLNQSLPHHPDDDYVLGLEKPIRTSSVGSKPDFARRKNSTPMLGVSCASRSWSDTSGSYFRNLFSSRSHDKQKDSLMLVDFSKNKSYDQIANSDEGKDKKSLSIERIKSTFAKHRSSTRVKKRVSEGDAATIGSGSFRGGGIEIPSVHSDYFQMDFNPSPRSNNSNNSNTSTNSDVPLSGYLPMRPGASLSFSSTGSTDYVDMSAKTTYMGASPGLAGSIAPTDSGYLEMTSPRRPLDTAPSPGAPGDGYVDMTQGSGGLSVSTETALASSFYSKQRKASSSFSHMPSVELPSPQEEGHEFSYLHEFDSKSSQKERKKSRRKSGKESSKRKKSDPNTGESLAETLRNRGSSHLASFSSFLSRKNSQNSSVKTPLSPTGSPLPKSSRNSNSPFPSLGRSKSKEARETSNPAVSQSPSACLSNAHPPFGFLPCMSSVNSQLSPNNMLGFMHSTLNPSFRDSDTMENENYWTVDTGSTSGCSGGSSIPRNLSNRELGSNCSCCDVKTAHRFSGAFDPHSNGEYCGDSRLACSNLSCCASKLSFFSEAESSQSKERGTSPSDPHNVYVNFSLGSDRPISATAGVSLKSNSCNCICNRFSSSRLVPSEKLPLIDNSLISLKNAKSQSELGRLSESSMEDSNSKAPSVFSAVQETQDSSSYVNMCPSSNERKSLILPSSYTKTVVEKPAVAAPSEERKILNTDPVSCASSISNASDYLEMDLRKHDVHSSTSNSCSCGSASCTAPSSDARMPNISSKSTVVKRPALPQALVEMRAEPSVPLEQLTLTDVANTHVPDVSPKTCRSGSYTSNLSSASKTDAVSIPSTVVNDGANSSGSYTERFRSHSGPGAPESHNGKDTVGLEATEETPRRGSEGETRALSACSSPMSYSPPTSPNLTSSSKSSLSEGGMSSASSTCTVVNVGLRLQQQQHANRKSHGSGSSTSTNTDSCSGSTPSPLNSSIINVPSVSLSTSKIKSSSFEQFGGSSASRQQSSVPHIEGMTSPRPKDNVVYACLDLAPPRTDVILSGDVSQRQRHNSCQTYSSPVVSSELSSSSSLSESIAPNRNSCDLSRTAPPTTSKLTPTNKIAAPTSEAAASLSYAEIDFKKSEGLRTACLAARDALRH